MYSQTEKSVLLLISSLASFLVPYTVSSLNVALPAIGSSFGLDAVTLGWVTTAYLLIAAVFMLPFGKLADIYGRKRVFIIGTILFAIGSLLAAISWSGSVIIIARMIQGLGGAMVFSTSMAIVTVVFPPGERGRAIGIITATVYAGLSLGPVLGGFLTQMYGWPSIFIVNVPLALIVVVLTILFLHDEWKDLKSGFDSGGAVLYGCMLMGIMYGLTVLPSPASILWIGGGVAGGYLFFRWEQKQERPLIRLSTFRTNRTFLCSNVAAMINYAVVFAVGFLVSLSLQYTRGFDPATTGMILLAQPLVQTVVSPLAGKASDSVEPAIIATLGMAATTIGLGVLLIVLPSGSVLWILAGLVILGLGYGLFSSPNTNAIMSSVEVTDLGMASGMVSTMRTVGQLISLAIAMMVFSVVIGTVEITPDVYHQLEQSTSIIFIICIGLGILGIFTSYVRGTVRNHESEE
ncbi:major facilitator superfamily MFS_1 [Methanospirillum hungatei JF-1]|uniref:Major facilitator superfamily MFS_1 n=1 Tax=Methanospirillum hungatei JF-1 (strain ATCC 27890 / DSM 864 / NBRC 100397 / JF-1) TaxID=323259 RepID=Q2FLU6_METHJ|nr:MFS transporter [Methanospirillum hungatei]ABD41661.1 major facilitator superfamily MFS_1 [Methanospirillum hungatei JF-1]